MKFIEKALDSFKNLGFSNIPIGISSQIFGLILFSQISQNLGTIGLGEWLLVSSVALLTTVLNFGIGNTLRNYLSSNQTLISVQEINFHTGNAVLKILIYSTPFLILNFIIPWELIIDQISNDGITALKILNLFFILNIPLGIVFTIFLALRKTHVYYLNQILFNLAPIIILLVLQFNKRNISIIDLAYIFGIVRLILSATFWLLLYRKYQVYPVFNLLRKYKLNTRTSINFQIAQFLGLSNSFMDSFILLKLTGALGVAEYGLINKINAGLISIYAITLTRFWDNTSFNKGLNIVKSQIKFLLGFAIFLFVLNSLGVKILGKIYFDFMISDQQLDLNLKSFYLFGILTLIMMINSLFINFQNGTGKIIYSNISGLLILLMSFSLVIIFLNKTLTIESFIYIKIFIYIMCSLINFIPVFNFR